MPLITGVSTTKIAIILKVLKLIGFFIPTPAPMNADTKTIVPETGIPIITARNIIIAADPSVTNADSGVNSTTSFPRVFSTLHPIIISPNPNPIPPINNGNLSNQYPAVQKVKSPLSSNNGTIGAIALFMSFPANALYKAG